MIITRKQLGLNIRKARIFRGLSQRELAESAGKRSAAYIAFIEAGQRSIDVIDLIRIAYKLEITVSRLINEKINKKNPVIQKLFITNDPNVVTTVFNKINEIVDRLNNINNSQNANSRLLIEGEDQLNNNLESIKEQMQNLKNLKELISLAKQLLEMENYTISE